MKYTVWIVPPEPTKQLLSSVIADLAVQFGGPVFEPHATILSDIEIELDTLVSSLKNIAINSSTLRLSLGPVSYSTTYFQNVFVRVNSTPELLNLNLSVKKACGIDNTMYMPHISLLYGDHAMDIRNQAAAAVVLPQQEFLVDSLVVTPATIDPSTWEHLANIPFRAAYS